jgi:hypothetical protein
MTDSKKDNPPKSGPEPITRGGSPNDKTGRGAGDRPGRGVGDRTGRDTDERPGPGSKPPAGH